MTLLFPNPQTKTVLQWSNYSGSLGTRAVPLFYTPDPLSGIGSTSGALRPQGDAVRALLDYCFTQTPPEPVRAMGSKYSFSRIIEPKHVALDTPNMNTMWKVSADSLTDSYKQASLASGRVPIFVEGGATVASMNRRLGEIGLALQTSGAGDGHRIAGCIATGTHGSALRIGAVHDTVLGLHLVVAPDRALFIHSASTPVFADDFAAWLEKQTGIPTTDLADDDAFATALVSLGSLGIVFSIIIETVPLYRLERMTFARPSDDPELMEAIRTLDTSALHPGRAEKPHHFDVVFNPYPEGTALGAYVTLLWKQPAGGPATFPAPVVPDLSSDTMGLIGSLVQAVDGFVPAPISTSILGSIIGGQLASRYAGSNGTVKFPGEIFGPTSLPPGSGASTEIVVSHDDIEEALSTLFAVLAAQGESGRHLLGAMAVRFIPQSKALLGMNIAPMNCFIELPSIRNNHVLDVYEACWDALGASGIRFTCHWGQLHGMTRARVDAYFGARAQTWRDTRASLLDETARAVFAAPLLADVGLG